MLLRIATWRWESDKEAVNSKTNPDYVISTNNRSVTSSTRTPTTIYQREKGRHDVWYWPNPDPTPPSFSNAACFYQATWTNRTHVIHIHASAPKLTRPPVFRWRQTSHASPSRKYWWWKKEGPCNLNYSWDYQNFSDTSGTPELPTFSDSCHQVPELFYDNQPPRLPTTSTYPENL